MVQSSGAPPSAATDDMLTRMKDRNFRDLIYLINKPPRWNEQVALVALGCFVSVLLCYYAHGESV